MFFLTYPGKAGNLRRHSRRRQKAVGSVSCRWSGGKLSSSSSQKRQKRCPLVCFFYCYCYYYFCTCIIQLEVREVCFNFYHCDVASATEPMRRGKNCRQVPADKSRLLHCPSSSVAKLLFMLFPLQRQCYLLSCRGSHTGLTQICMRVNPDSAL